MVRALAVLVSAFLIAHPSPLRAAAQAIPSAEELGRVPAIAAVTMSPSGNLLAWIDRHQAVAHVVVFDLAAGAEKRRARLPADMKPRNLFWSDDQTLLLNVSMMHSHTGLGRDQSQWFRTLAMDVAGGNPRTLLQKSGVFSWVTGASIIAPRGSRAQTALIASWNFAETGYKPETSSRLAADARMQDGSIACSK